jgi:hypothetical protein
MAYEKVGFGYLSKNKWRKEEHQPAYRGKLTVEIDGKKHECSLSGWIKEKDGEKFFSLSLEKQQEEQPAQKSFQSADEDSVPF